MKILLIAHGNSPFARCYYDAFSRQGHEVRVLTLQPVPDTPPPYIFGVGRWAFDPDDKPGRGRWRYLLCVPPVRKIVRDFAPDVVFGLFLTSCGILASLSGHSSVVLCALGSDVNRTKGNVFWRILIRAIARRAILVLAVSESLKDTLLIDHGIIDANKLAVSPIGVDTNKIQFADASNRPNQNVIISTRAHAPVYDQVTLIAAARLLLASGEKFKIIFASDRRVECTEKLVKGTELEPYVEFLHGYRSEEISLILANADVYVSSSKSDGTSQSLLEAMSSGVFPIVSDIIANAPWVSDGENGYIFRVGDSEQLANKLKAAFTKEELRKQAAIKNRRLVEEKGDLFRLGSNVMNKVTNALTSGESRP